MKSGIYRIKNIINNNCYYGSSKDINKRWNKHKNELNKDKHGNILLQRSWNKYGKEAINPTIKKYTTKESEN